MLVLALLRMPAYISHGVIRTVMLMEAVMTSLKVLTLPRLLLL